MTAKQITLKPYSKHLYGMDIPSEPGTYYVELQKGETAWQPGTTKYYFGGPGRVTYRVFADGEVEATPSATILRRYPS